MNETISNVNERVLNEQLSARIREGWKLVSADNEPVPGNRDMTIYRFYIRKVVNNG